MIKYIFFIVCYILSVLGFMYMLIYLNLLSMGYTVIDYLRYILTRYECISGLISFVFLIIFIIKGDKKNDIHV